MMCRRYALFFLLLSIAPCDADDEKKPAAPLDLLKGKWILVSTEEGGKAKNYTDRSIVFDGNEYRWYYKDLLVKQAIVTVNLKVKPPTMDLFHRMGPAKGKTALCIFKLEKDTLTIADGSFDLGRPSEFDSGKPPCFSVTLWKRQKE